MTFITFYEETIEFLKDMLKDPINARPSDTLEGAGYDNTRLRGLLRERGVVEMTERIDEPTDERTRSPRSMYHLSYKVRRDGFKDKLRELFRETYKKGKNNTQIKENHKMNRRIQRNNKPVTLTEQQLNMLVEAAVQEYLIQEGLWDTTKAIGQTAGKYIGQGAKAVGKAVGSAAKGVGNAVGNFAGGVKRGFSNATQGMQAAAQNVSNTFQNNQMNNNVQRLIGQVNKNLDDLEKYASQNPAVLGNQGSRTLAAIQQLKRQLAGARGRAQSIANG